MPNQTTKAALESGLEKTNQFLPKYIKHSL
jgi:hypothetical protein